MEPTISSGLDYLWYKRGISPHSAELYSLGYSGKETVFKIWDKLNILERATLVSAGILKKTGKDIFSDGRIIFPITKDGDTIDFTSRAVYEDAYLKHRHLHGKADIVYGYDVAKEREGHIVVVESPMDTIIVNQAFGDIGFRSVAVYGTMRFNDRFVDQIIELANGNDIIVCFDSDLNCAGTIGAIRACSKIQKKFDGGNLYLMSLPEMQTKDLDIGEWINKMSLLDARLEMEDICREHRFISETHAAIHFGVKAKSSDRIFDKRSLKLIETLRDRLVLVPAGEGKLRGLCPFHPEKKPSFTVYEDTGTFYCFGCSATGRLEDLKEVLKVEKIT